jgi:hypothetical protein
MFVSRLLMNGKGATENQLSTAKRSRTGSRFVCDKNFDQIELYVTQDHSGLLKLLYYNKYS